MGSCFSTHPMSLSSPTAKVITSNGRLREYALPATASLALDREVASSPSFFMCHSDSLSYDKLIPVLDLDDQMQPNQMYFILPKSMLRQKLSAPDMAAMAVVAASALSKDGVSRRRVPVPSLMGAEGYDGSNDDDKAKMERSGSVRRLHRYTSRRAKMAVRSFRLRLATIYEAAKEDSRFS